MGLPGPGALRPQHVMRRLDHVTIQSYGELFEWLAPGELVAEAPQSWARDWTSADPDTFQPTIGSR